MIKKIRFDDSLICILHLTNDYRKKFLKCVTIKIESVIFNSNVFSAQI